MASPVTYAVSFFGGVVGSLHCLGMCGALPLLLGERSGRDGMLRQLLYNLGRVQALVCIGAASGAVGAALVGIGHAPLVESMLAVTAGLLMIVVGLQLLGLLGQVTTRGAALVQATVGRVFGSAMRSRSPAAPVALGVFNAFLPCQLIYAFAANAATTASPVDGALTMFFFGLGTVPAMLAVGALRPLAAPALRKHLNLASAVLVLGFGVLTCLRGLAGPAGWSHHVHGGLVGSPHTHVQATAVASGPQGDDHEQQRGHEQLEDGYDHGRFHE